MTAVASIEAGAEQAVAVTSVRLDPATYVALSALRWYPDAPADAFELACLELPAAPSLNAVLERAWSLRLLHVCLLTFRTAIEASSDAHEWFATSDIAGVILARQMADLEELLDAADDAGVDLIVPKGISFALDLHPQPVLMADVDLLARVDELNTAVGLLRELGYRHRMTFKGGQLVRPKATLVAAVEQSVPYHGELYPHAQLRRFSELERHRGFIERSFRHAFILGDTGIYRPASVDLHYSLNPLSDLDPLGERPTEDFWWASPRVMPLGRRQMTVLSDDVVAAILPYRLYHEIHCHGGRGLKPLSDLVALARRDRVDYSALEENAVRFAAIRPSLFYVYRFLRDFCAIPVPETTLCALGAPSQASYSDWGDFLPTALDVRTLATLEAA